MINNRTDALKTDVNLLNSPPLGNYKRPFENVLSRQSRGRSVEITKKILKQKEKCMELKSRQTKGAFLKK